MMMAKVKAHSPEQKGPSVDDKTSMVKTAPKAPLNLWCTLETPAGKLFDGEANAACFQAKDGHVVVCPGHVDFLTVLKKGVLTFKAEREKDDITYEVGDGLVHVSKNRAHFFVTHSVLEDSDNPAEI